MVASLYVMLKSPATAWPSFCNRLSGCFLNPIAIFPVALSLHPRYKIGYPQTIEEMLMAQKYVDSYGTRKTLTVGSQNLRHFPARSARKGGL